MTKKGYRIFDSETEVNPDRIIRIKSYKIDLGNVMDTYMDASKGANAASKALKIGAENTSYYFPLPISLDDDNTQNWSNKGAMSFFLGGASEATRGLQGVTGFGITPFYAQTYEGQSPRSVSLSFMLNARSEKEFSIINKALINLKADMTPGVPEGKQEDGKSTTATANVSKQAAGASSYVFQYPPRLFELTFGKDTSHINTVMRYELCALASLDINYGADGMMGLHWGGKPKSIAVNMTFLEFEPKEREDWV